MRRVELFQARDFTGGLNYREDTFALAPNETPDCLNVRLMPRGGVARRKTMGVLNTTNFSSQAARNIWAFYGNGVSQIVVQDGNDAKYSTGGATFTAINPDALTIAAGSKMRAAAMNRVGTASSDRLYVQRNAEQVAWKWDGTTAVVLADAHGAYNDNLAAPAGGKMPIAKFITDHGGFMFHANTVEAGVAKPNRVRFSFPGEPEDYRTNDYFDVGADDGDSITGICSVLRYLFVFKNRSVWYVVGTDPTNFQVQRLSDQVGCVSQESITKDEWRAYFFDPLRGMYSVTPQHRFLPRIEWMWDRIYPKIGDGTISASNISKIVCGWVDKRLWVAVPWGTSTVPSRVFVWDEQVGRGTAFGMAEPPGVWYCYEYGVNATPTEIGPFLEYRPINSAARFLCCGNDAKNVFILDSGTGATDATDGAATSSFPSYYRTAWYNANLPGIKKRWRRHGYVMDADVSYTFGVSHYVDYQQASPKTVSQETITAETAGGGKLWGANNWNTDLWGGAPAGDEKVIRGQGSIGTAYAVQMRLDGPVDKQWGFNGFDLRYIPRRIR